MATPEPDRGTREGLGWWGSGAARELHVMHCAASFGQTHHGAAFSHAIFVISYFLGVTIFPQIMGQLDNCALANASIFSLGLALARPVKKLRKHIVNHFLVPMLKDALDAVWYNRTKLCFEDFFLSRLHCILGEL